MQFGGAGLGSVSLGSILNDPGASNDEALSPIVTEINGVDVRGAIRMDTLEISDTLGQPVTASFTLHNLQPEVGQPVRVRYFSQVLFAGIIDHVTKTSPDLTTMRYQCDCLDWSQILLRRKLRRNFTDATVQAVVDSILDNELTGEGLTIGTIDARAVVPLVDARDAKVFEVLRSLAGATGQTFYIDYDKSIQMRSTTVPVAPLVLNEANTLLDGSTLNTDTETYRNRQTVIVTGTPGEDEDALTTSIQRENTDQIAARAALEGGTGIYEEIEEITHPTSNDGVELALLGISYANLRLATSGTPRLTFHCRARGYGFRAGQIATVDLPTFGITGTFVIQKVSIRELAAAELFHTLELTNSSLQQRAYEAWLGIVGKGKVTVQVPSATTTGNMETFNAPGADTWTVPAGVTTVEFTVYGGSGGGGGSVVILGGVGPIQYKPGGDGGNSGKAVSILTDLVEGEVFDITVGSAGAGGPTFNSRGTSGTLSDVKRGGVTIAQGNAGTFGGKGGSPDNGFDGTPGSGVGDAVSVGGGKIGGPGAPAPPGQAGTAGQDGLVEVRW